MAPYLHFIWTNISIECIIHLQQKRVVVLIQLNVNKIKSDEASNVSYFLLTFLWIAREVVPRFSRYINGILRVLTSQFVCKISHTSSMVSTSYPWESWHLFSFQSLNFIIPILLATGQIWIFISLSNRLLLVVFDYFL